MKVAVARRMLVTTTLLTVMTQMVRTTMLMGAAEMVVATVMAVATIVVAAAITKPHRTLSGRRPNGKGGLRTWKSALGTPRCRPLSHYVDV